MGLTMIQVFMYLFATSNWDKRKLRWFCFIEGQCLCLKANSRDKNVQMTLKFKGMIVILEGREIH